MLTCYRYIELNPVRAGIVRSPGEYPWSSFQVNAWGREDGLVNFHESYLALGHDAEERRDVYQKLIGEALSEEDLDEVRTATHRCVPWGSPHFKSEIDRHLQREISYLPVGRPCRGRTIRVQPSKGDAPNPLLAPK